MQTLDQQGKGRRPYIGVTGITTVVYNLAQMLGPTTSAGGICWLVGLVMVGLLCKWAF
jgi:hypothetical protein